ncbi:DNA-methyltransferase [Salinisphaera sp. PC39]|uniref:DNA adenine methylase n=1 Tax=Salinisphaera sp. PC39 TaxID=1304156 RepID=UPI00333E8D3D
MRYYTPLRYPGGKASLAPFIRDIVLANRISGGTYVEPFAGGGGVALELLMTGCMRRIILNDIDPGIHAFWCSVLNAPGALIERLQTVPLTIDEWHRQREILETEGHGDILALGFAALYLNRVNRSGILRGGIIGGLSQTGRWLMDARFNRQAIAQRISRVAQYANKIAVYREDAEHFLAKLDLPERSLLYIDPPYYHKGQRLYRNHYEHADHARVAELVQSRLDHPWIVSYDDTQEIAELYRRCRQAHLHLRYSAQVKRHASELVIFSDDLSIPDREELAS